MKDAIIPDWPAPPQVKAASSTRSLNLGFFSDDDPKQIEENRQRMHNDLQLPNPPYWLKQVHGNHVVRAQTHPDHLEADASFTTESGVVCVVMTADCLPILLADKKGGAVAAIHAGWKSLYAGIIAKTIAKMPVDPHDILAWLGPCIGPDAFVVRKDVFQPFTQQWPETEGAFSQLNDEQWHASLCHIAEQRLRHAGVTLIYGGEHCTFSDSARFFSYRRDGAKTGRMASLIWLE